MAQLIDLLHLGRPAVIASYLLPEALALVDCGPAVCADKLEAGLARHGLALANVRDLLLTHIHPDHAGAAGTLVERHPKLRVHVHELGAPHLVEPERLEQSARRLYGEEFERLFGEIRPVHAENVHVLGEEILGLTVVPTPGHAPHHVAFFDDGACYPGDAVGCLLPPGDFVYPASAPPGIDLAAWERSLDAIEGRRPEILRLPHFGEVADPDAHIERVRGRLREWAARVRSGLSVAEFVGRAEAELRREGPQTVAQYRQLPGFDLSYAGLKRYLDKRADEGGS